MADGVAKGEMKNQPINVVCTKSCRPQWEPSFSYLGNNFTLLYLQHKYSDSRQFRRKSHMSSLFSHDDPEDRNPYTNKLTESKGRETKNINLTHKKY